MFGVFFALVPFLFQGLGVLRVSCLVRLRASSFIWSAIRVLVVVFLFGALVRLVTSIFGAFMRLVFPFGCVRVPLTLFVFLVWA